MLKHIILILLTCFSLVSAAQVGPPSLRCVSVVPPGDVTLTWIIPADPLNQFTRYEVYHASVPTGPYTLVGNVTTYTQNTFTHVGANANLQTQYYYIITVSSTSVSSAPSDTLRSIYLNLNNPGNGVGTLTWNSTRTPLLPSASTQYKLSREYPVGTWTQLYNGPGQMYRDTVSICQVAYNYIVETSDAFGCVSKSNISGGILNDLTPPRIPFFDSASVNPNGTTTLGWQPSASADAIGYVIYKHFGSVWTPVDTVWGINNTSYTYTSSTAGNASEDYCIAALDSCRNISPLGTSQTTMHLSSTFDICSRSARLNWNAYGSLPDGILNYAVYCSTNGGAYTLIGSTTSNLFEHTGLVPGNNYCYVVVVMNTTGHITASSNLSCVVAVGANGPAYAYIRSVSVNPSQQVSITYIVDNSRPYKGVKLYKSPDGINFNFLAAYNNTTSTSYTDADVHCSKQNYYYMLTVTDTCGNDGVQSNVSKTILLEVKHDADNIFYNDLSWDDYSSWLGNVASYNIYRAVDGVFNPVPVVNLPLGNRHYVDDVSDFVSATGKFSYYVEAVEGGGNPYGLQDSAHSNIADAYAEVAVFVPSAFAPKGKNPVWLPIAQFVEKTDYKVTVFDRWGTKVFQTESDTQGWDGAHCTDDVYAYLIQYKNARGEFIELKGTVMLVR
ncbi:MAG: gliding motility-associated C-terminal domain-containing protein [Bacteroidetes bacterium]|nr:gliding motility-associated C-terminal domain-containing protein [Bacteroidota bacterium]